jgi:hypothetical protein
MEFIEPSQKLDYIIEKKTGKKVKVADLPFANPKKYALGLIKIGKYVREGEQIAVNEQDGIAVLEQERQALVEERRQLEIDREDLNADRADFEAERARFEKEKKSPPAPQVGAADEGKKGGKRHQSIQQFSNSINQ